MNYCTYLTVYHGSKLPPFYIGSSSVDKVRMGYHGSVLSKKYMLIWKKELKDNPRLFSTRIISRHESREQAIEKETSLQIQLDVVSNPMYINMSIAGGKFGIMTVTQEQRDNMSKASKGRPKSIEHRNKIAEANRKKALDPSFIAKLRKPKPDGHAQNVSKALSGVKKSKEHCKALSLAQTGKKHDSPSTEVRLKMSLAQKGKTQRTLSCPHCSKTGGYAAIKRWHFDNCKGKICL